MPFGIQEGMSEIGISKYRALLFSVQDYERGSELSDLSTPNEDVRRVSAILRDRYGFETEVVTDATEAQVIASLDRLRNDSTEDEAVLIYYAGHGCTTPKKTAATGCPPTPSSTTRPAG